MPSSKCTEKGQALIEFTLVAIPLIFTIISVVEISRGMWAYHSICYGVNEAIRFASTKGKGCSSGTNTCGVTVGGMAQQIATSVGLPSADLNVTLTSATGNVSCNPVSACYSNVTAWPPDGANSPGMDIKIAGQYTFVSALGMFWPGAGSGTNFGTFYLPAYSRQQIQF
jgi:Flp pilus assembly protein TadG